MEQLLTRGTVWLAVSLYVASEWTRSSRRTASQWLTATGCGAFIAHVACAFQYYHHWSHAVAYAATARETAQFVGWNWGGGLYLNYAFALVWMAEVVWFLGHPESYLHRGDWINWSARGFILFMIFNGTVVFVRGPLRWFGLMLCLMIVACWVGKGIQHCCRDEATRS